MRVFDEQRPATTTDVAWLRRAMKRRLSELRLPDEIVDDLQIVVSELAANACLHGKPAPKTLSVRVELSGPEISILLFDDSGPFDPTPRMADTPTPYTESRGDPLTLSGRGLWLAREALDSAEWRYEGGNWLQGRRSLRARRTTALVVEDEPALLSLYSQMLRRDYRVIGCGSLEEARAILSATKVDVVLADVHLGDGRGVALPDWIADRDHSRAAPVVLISSDTTDETREAALRLGAEFYLVKPVRAKVLRETVELALSRAALRGAQLARAFAARVDGFLTVNLPERLGRWRLASAGGTAASGGGDLVVHLAGPTRDRIVLIDVMGHGVGARAWAIAYAAIVRTLHHVAPDLPASAFLTELARIVWVEPTLERALATALVVDLDADGATFASAGHPAPLVSGNVLRHFSVATPLLGVMAPEPFESQHITLAADERMALFTDGLDPAGVAAGDDPPAWFLDTLRASADRPLAVAADALRAATEAALGPQPKDDWTFALIERAEA